jgi:hypothetical protein
MLVSEILSFLPESLEWMVLFNLSAVGQITTAETICAMYHLPLETALEPYSHVVLTNQGRFLASQTDHQLVEAISGEIWNCDRTPASLGDRYSQQLATVSVDEADCLGLAQESPFAPVLLHLRLEGHYGKAQAIFAQEPSFEHYELLQAVGVKFLGGELRQDYYLAHFQNRLPTHIHAGILSHFSRTAHCNIFFFRHGNIDAELESGLLQAAHVRVQWAKKQSWTKLIELATLACERSLSMTCQPPAPEPAFAYGDLVPLGFVLLALRQAATEPDAPPELLQAQEQLQARVIAQQEDQLWAFHQKRLITATDSALVLLGIQSLDSVTALERFADGQGGYYPQLWSEVKEVGKMVVDRECEHWCQPDYATTCLVRGLRQSIGLPEKTSIAYLTQGFATRSGLFFANPYLVDWVLAESIREDEQAAPLRDRLLSEVMASLNADYSFGQYDVAFSTALGILTLVALGVRDRTIRVLQLRLMELINYPIQQTPNIPFYSTLKTSKVELGEAYTALQISEFFNRGSQGQKQIRAIDDQLHHISLYLDTHYLITQSLFALALAQPCQPETWEQGGTLDRAVEVIPNLASSRASHARYRCQNHSEYIAKFALPPYLKQLVVS